MQKVITSRFATKCRSCKQGISAGERVYWYGSKQGVSHIHCAAKAPDAPAGKPDSDSFDFPIKFQELRRIYRAVTSGDFSDFTINDSLARRIVNGWESKTDWNGCTVPEMNSWLSEGYVVEGLEGIDSSLIPTKPKRRTRFAEEGDEMLIDLAWSGVDEHWIHVEKKNQKPGLKIEIHLTFNANFSAKIIVDYERWLARMLQTFEENAVDVEVDLICQSSGSFSSFPSSKNSTKVRVKEAGEAADFASWSAMFSPGGFRHLTFLGIMLGGEHFKQNVSYGLGSARYGSQWSVEYSEESNELTIRNPGNTQEFPEFEMTQKLQAVIAKVAG